MADEKIKVFISWSGELSKAIATALREWLPNLFDLVEPWMSDSDIAAGQRGLSEIESKLADTRFGILVVTQANQHAPWLNFEAGALSKVIAQDADQRVVPLLVDIDSPTQITGPLTQFQAKVLGEEGMRALLHSLGDIANVSRGTIDDRVGVYWPKLEAQVQAAKDIAVAVGASGQSRRSTDDMLGEILGHVRELRTIPVSGTESGRRLERSINRPFGVDRNVANDVYGDVVGRAGESIGVDVLHVDFEDHTTVVTVATDTDADSVKQFYDLASDLVRGQVVIRRSERRS